MAEVVRDRAVMLFGSPRRTYRDDPGRRGETVQVDPEAGVSAIYLERIARDLTTDEARVLERVAELREQGLALCRAGQVREGGAVIARARDALTGPRIGRQAYVLADSFLCAGEAFAHHVSRNAHPAIASLLAAIDRCRELRDDYGYPVEGRRIHLACNVLRVRVDAAADGDIAVTATQLLNLIGTSDRRFWPYPDLDYQSEPDRLDEEVRWALMDQALAVVSKLGREALVRVAAAFPSSPEEPPRPLTARTKCFVEAIWAYSSGDIETFLARCIDFLPGAAQPCPALSGIWSGSSRCVGVRRRVGGSPISLAMSMYVRSAELKPPRLGP